MSYSLSISGHHHDPTVAEQIDELVRTKGAEIVDAVRELDPAALTSAMFSGPSGSVNYLHEEPKPDDEPTTGAPTGDSA